MLTVNFITPSKMIVVPLMPKRFRFEVIDDNGNKISLGLEGYFSKEQVERLLRLVSEVSEIKGLQQRPFDESTIFGKVPLLLTISAPRNGFHLGLSEMLISSVLVKPLVSQ